MRNAIKHERCNADADFNNKRQAFYICTSALNTDKNRMCTKHIRDKRGLEVFFVHLCISTQSFQLQEWEMNESSHCMWCIPTSTALPTKLNTYILFTVMANSWKSEAFKISKVFVTYYRVLLHARHRHLEQNTIGCLSKAVQPRNLSVSWQTGQGAARCLSSGRKL